MRLTVAIDAFIAEMRREGRIASDHTELAYRTKLIVHAEDVGNRDPSKTGRADIRKTLGHWPNPNSQAQAHSVLASFYRWCVYEGIRDTNPAEQVRRAKTKAPTVFRPTRAEVVALMAASNAKRRWRWTVHLGVCAGLRSQELRGLQGRHLARHGFVWVSADIGKGGKERWMPVLAELEPIVEEIVTLVGHEEYVIPGRKVADPPFNTKILEVDRQLAPSSLYRMCGEIGKVAGIAPRVTPHTLRHAYGDHVARYAGLRAAQALLGHVSVETTAKSYTDRTGLDELEASVRGFVYDLSTLKTPSTPAGKTDDT